MRRCVILLWILAVLTVPVLALDVLEEERQILNVDTLTDGLPGCRSVHCGRPCRRRLCC